METNSDGQNAVPPTEHPINSWEAWKGFDDRLRQREGHLNEIQQDISRMVDNLVSSSAGLRVTPSTIAKAAAYRFAAWSILFIGTCRRVSRQVVCATSKAIYETVKEPPPIVLPETEEWCYPLDATVGSKGETKTIVLEPESPFQAERLMASDLGGGYHTRITQMIVGGKLQGPAIQTGTLTLFYDRHALGNSRRLDWCQVGQKIKITVEFLEDSTFEGALFGKAIRPAKDHVL